MQVFDGVESEGRRNPNSSQDTEFRERPFTELIDEDKQWFAFRKICASIFGGIRGVQDES